MFNFLDNVATSAINSCIKRTYLSLELLSMDGTLAWHRTHFAPFYISISTFDAKNKKFVFYTFIACFLCDDFVGLSGIYSILSDPMFFVSSSSKLLLISLFSGMVGVLLPSPRL